MNVAGSKGAERVLVIVESPAKAKTIAGYLTRSANDGREYDVEASVGHIRDLAAKASQLPESVRKQPWAKYAVNTEEGYAPYYVVHADKKQRITELKRKLADADELILATDEDREGEAIAWHLLEVLKPKVPVRRMVFHEITEQAIGEALQHTRDLDMQLVDAQETRRIVDRLYGYPVSEVLWRKIGREARSAGRVQSVAVRLVVDRERERIAFRSASYWDLAATFDPEDPSPRNSSRSIAAGSRPARISTIALRSPPPMWSCSTKPVRMHWRQHCRVWTTPCARWWRSHPSAARTPPS